MKKLLSIFLLLFLSLMGSNAQVFDEPEDSPYVIVDEYGNLHDPDYTGPNGARGPGGPPAPIDDFIPFLAAAGAVLGVYFRYIKTKPIAPIIKSEEE